MVFIPGDITISLYVPGSPASDRQIPGRNILHDDAAHPGPGKKDIVMSKTGVVYATRTSHSQKYAEAIGKALNVRPENVISLPAPQPADLLFIVGGIYGGKSLPGLLAYVQSLNAGLVKRAALVTSCASNRRKQKQIRCILEEKGIEILDELVCPGSLLFLRPGHPNEADMKRAADFALRLAKSA
jgi:hypothetical protein